jgi:hypothetical protein
VRGAHQARASVERLVQVLAVDDHRVSCVDSGAHRRCRRFCRPRHGGKLQLKFENCTYCVVPRRERRRDAIAHGREHDAVVALDRLAQHSVVESERSRHRVGMLFPPASSLRCP